MMKLSKQSQKTYGIAIGKNKQEEKRLDLETKVLEKQTVFDDTKWARDFIKLKRSLGEISLSCDYNDELANIGNRILTSAPPKKSHLSSKSASLRLKSAPSKTYSAHSNQRRVLSTRQTDLGNNKYLVFPGKFLKSYTSLVGSKSDRTEQQLENFCVKNIFLDDYIDRLSASSPAKSRPSTWRCLSGGDRTVSSTLRYDLFSVVEDTTTNCNDDGGDDDSSDLSSFIADDEDDIADDEVNFLFENDLVEKYKSIRRSQTKSGSSKHIQFQMKSLKARTCLSLENNRKLFAFSDRNVRYGGPLPSRPLYRELRILERYELTT